MKTAYLKILTWKDSAAVMLAEHYYGTLVLGDRELPVHFNLTTSEAKRLNKSEEFRMIDTGHRYNPGDQSSRFCDLDKLLDHAVKLFKKNQGSYEILLVGDNAICEPQEMIFGPKQVVRRANKLYTEF